MKLYRPVGIQELRLIAASNWAAFPPRLEGQPIFYPVLNERYATQIARDWNPTDAASGFAGFVTAFTLNAKFVTRYEVQVVGDGSHQELWVPAEELREFNRNIEGRIEVLSSFYGERFDEQIDATSQLPVSVRS
tara:strand:+ start:76 stop:477 length:402 start_codon:yes stop_codon:yes gene_type:complete